MEMEMDNKQCQKLKQFLSRFKLEWKFRNEILFLYFLLRLFRSENWELFVRNN